PAPRRARRTARYTPDDESWQPGLAARGRGSYARLARANPPKERPNQPVTSQRDQNAGPTEEERTVPEVELPIESAEIPEGGTSLTVGDIRRRALSGSVLLSAKGIAVQVLGLVSTIVIAHYLTPNELGMVAFGITLTTLLAFIGGSQGLAGALIRRQE